MNLKKLAYTILASSVLAVWAGPSHASLMLTLDDGAGHSQTITDNGTGDLNPSAGGIFWMISVGTWMGSIMADPFSMVAGLSNSPGNSVATLELNALIHSRGAGTLSITLWDNGFTSPNGSGLDARTDVNMNSAAGNISFISSLNGNSVSTFGAHHGLFTGTNSTGLPNLTGGFGLKQVATITHQGAGTSNFDIITTVPEPATLGLLGLGLIGLGFIRRNRKI